MSKQWETPEQKTVKKQEGKQGKQGKRRERKGKKVNVCGNIPSARVTGQNSELKQK